MIARVIIGVALAGTVGGLALLANQGALGKSTGAYRSAFRIDPDGAVAQPYSEALKREQAAQRSAERKRDDLRRREAYFAKHGRYPTSRVGSYGGGYGSSGRIK